MKVIPETRNQFDIYVFVVHGCTKYNANT